MNNSLIKKTALGGITSNPIFVLVLGMCPTLALSNSIENAFWLGLATLLVLICSNIIISLLRKLLPDKVRIPCYILVIATFVSVTDMLLEWYLDPAFYANIGTGIKLIVVNCIILARAEAFASNNNVVYATIDGVSMGLGFFGGILLLAAFRELLWNVLGITIFAQTSGGFLALAIVMGAFNFVISFIKQHSKPKTNLVAEV